MDGKPRMGVVPLRRRPCDGARYRYRMFSEVEVTYGVIYGANVGSSGPTKSSTWTCTCPQETTCRTGRW